MILLIIIVLTISAGVIIYIKYNSEEEFYIEESNSIINVNEVVEQEIGETKEKIIVHVTGAVNKEGIVELEEGSRIIDAIEMAGGAKEDANLSKINLAYQLEDGQKLYVPNINDKEEIEYITEDVAKNNIVNNDGIVTDEKENNKNKTNIESEKKVMVNINKATQAELENLPGIGPAIATRIIEYRNENGKFSSIDDIKNVKGIGDAKYDKIKDSIEV